MAVDYHVNPTQKTDRKLSRLIARIDRLVNRGVQVSARFSRWRMAIFIAGLISSVTAYQLEWYHLGNGNLAVFILIFGTVAWYHTRLEDRIHRLRVWRTIKTAHLARLRLDWTGIPKATSPASFDMHPYALDLDLIGPHSLFTLLNTTLSTTGRERLESWLLDQNTTPPDAPTWTARQALVKELAGLPLFRDRLTLEAALVGEGEIDGKRLLSILMAPAAFSGILPTLMVQGLLATCTITLGLAAALGLLPAYWTFSFAAYVIAYLFTSGRTATAFTRALSVHHELDKLGAVFRYLLGRSFVRTPALGRLCGPLLHAHKRPDKYIREFARVSHALSVRAHPLVHLALNALIPWDLGWAYRLDQLQGRVLPEVPGWLETLAELEAAIALGNFADLNPTYTWPRLAPLGENGQSASLAAKGLGHPLIPAAQRVTNDVELKGLGRLVIITGSNMSGKSTFLRTLGINACLAQAGAPVCASALEGSWVRLYCCIRVDDSLEAGMSFFYAEVKRLKHVLDATQDYTSAPVLYLIDEIFKGTNNRERIIGSRAYIKGLAGGNGFGLITTHDLELADLEKDIPKTTNAHFEESVAAKELTFDYTLRPGPCPTTNALRIMALEGLPVPEGPE